MHVRRYALDAPEWVPVREQVLTAAELRESNGTPRLIVLHFGSDGVVIGDGYDREFGDGDQILVHPLPEAQLSEFRTEDLLNDVTFL